jgi:enoyl-CoA hydratase/carnithine racemase
MKQESEGIFARGNLEFKIINNVGVLNLKNNIFEMITDLAESAEFFGLLERSKSNKDIHALMIINESGCLNTKKYSEFLNMVIDKDTQNGFNLSSGVARTRQIVNLNNFIRRAAEFDKLIFIALQGEVVTPFLGASLAADYRFASEDVTFSLCHLGMGIHPSGALPYFLPKYLGQGKASELLFNCNDISVKEALNLGLINKVFPSANFEQDCIASINQMVEGNANVLKCTKKLLKFSIKDLEEYISIEESNYIRT